MSTAFEQEVLHAFAQFVAPVAAAAPEEQAREIAPLWTPLEAQPGRGFLLPDGRLVSPQRLASESLADELYFGGAGGGGKTDLEIGEAVTHHRNSVIFRREFTQFRGADGLIARSEEIIGDVRYLNRGTSTWRLPTGRALEFGAVKNESDVRKWKGRPHDLICFDEIPEFTLGQYRFLTGWLRTTVIGQRCRIIAAGNPPTTPEGAWVIAYWAPWLDKRHPRPAQPGELRWYATIGGKDVERPDGAPFEMPEGPERAQLLTLGLSTLVRPRSRTFIPAYVEDNPYYMRTGYVDVLNNLPEPLRSQLRFGDFQASQADNPWQVIPTAWVKAAQARWRSDGAGRRPLSAAGVDCSRGGTDEFVIAPRYDEWFAELSIHPATEAPNGKAGAQLVWAAIDGDTGIPVNVDIGGTAGGSVYDSCVDLDLQAVAMNGSERDPEWRDRSGKLASKNNRAKWHWRLRELLDPDGGQEIALPPDPQLAADLCAAHWRPTPHGIQVEDKEAIKKRIGRSPDRGEAVIYAAANEGGPSLEPGARHPLFH